MRNRCGGKCGRSNRALIEGLESRQLLTASIAFNEFPAIGNGTNFVQNLTAGSDGNVYFSSQLANNIGSIGPNGGTKIYDTSAVASHGASGMTRGADGNIYFNAGNNLGEFNVASGTVSSIPLSMALNSAGNMTLGPDGNFWVDDFFSTIERVTPAGQVTRFSYTGDGSGQVLSFNSQLYFTSGNFIRDVGTDGTFGTAFGVPSGGRVQALAVGPDGNLWFTEQVTANNTTTNFYGYLTPGGTIKEFSSPIGPVAGIATGSDGKVYFRAADYLVGITTDGTIVAEQNLGGGNSQDGKELISLGSNLWYNESFADQIGVAYINGAPGGGGGGGGGSGPLSVAVTNETLPANVVAGGKTTGVVDVKLTDSGAAFAGRATVALYASPDQSPADGTLITRLATTLKLKSGQFKSLVMKVAKLPASLAAGTYNLLVQATTSAGTSAAAAATGTVTVAPAFIALSGTLASLSSKGAGKPALATLTVDNGGNVTAAGNLPIALSLRPAGTDGSSDISLGTVDSRIKIAPGKPGVAKLKFTVPMGLPAGSFLLVIQLDPANVFGEPALPGIIVSSQSIVIG